MLIPELIKQSVAGQLRFEFIDSTLTVSNGKMLSSLRGSGRANPADNCFHFHFLPRAPLLEEWTRSGGHMDNDNGHERVFRIDGVERGSANWSGQATRLRLVHGAEGDAIHARVAELSHSDERSVHLSFTRVILSGRFNYPVTIRHHAGLDTRRASVELENIKVDFRDYGSYTEICAYGTGELPDAFADHAARALGNLLERRIEWVYRERHADRRRMISVRALDDVGSAAPADSETAYEYEAFWKAYARELQALL